MPKKSTLNPSRKLHQRAEDHNYDDSPSKLRSIIRNKNCDLGTALLVYWRGDPNYYRLFPNRWEMKGDPSADVALFDVLVEIERRVTDGRYSKFEIPFDPFLDVGRTNWAENHYEFEWDDFYCDLPVQMYGESTRKPLASVRPISDRPEGLSYIADAENDTFDTKTQNAIDALEKHNREGSYAGVFVEERDGSYYTPGIHVNFQHQKSSGAYLRTSEVNSRRLCAWHRREQHGLGTEVPETHSGSSETDAEWHVHGTRNVKFETCQQAPKSRDLL